MKPSRRDTGGSTGTAGGVDTGMRSTSGTFDRVTMSLFILSDPGSVRLEKGAGERAMRQAQAGHQFPLVLWPRLILAYRTARYHPPKMSAMRMSNRTSNLRRRRRRMMAGPSNQSLEPRAADEDVACRCRRAGGPARDRNGDIVNGGWLVGRVFECSHESGRLCCGSRGRPEAGLELVNHFRHRLKGAPGGDLATSTRKVSSSAGGMSFLVFESEGMGPRDGPAAAP